MDRIGLLGAGAHADEIAEYLPEGGVAFRAVDADHLSGGSPVLVDIATTEPDLLATPVVAAVGAPGLRRTLIERWGGHVFASVVAPSAVLSPSAVVAEGSVVMAGAVISARVQLGRHVAINIGATVSHDSVLGDYATISPGVRIAGRCVIGAGVFLGIGAVVSHGVSIVDGAVVGAGAVVLSDITEPGTYVGAPARLVKRHEGWLPRL